MFTAIISGISSALKATAAVFGWAGKRSDLNNTPQMQQNAAALTREEIAAKAAAEVANGNLTDVQKDAAEQ